MLLAAPLPPRSTTSRRAPARLPEAEVARCISLLLPEAEVALRVVALRCAAHARAPPPSPPTAEALFARELAARETAPAGRAAEQQQQRWSGERSLRQPQLQRLGTGHGGGSGSGTGTAAPGGRRPKGAVGRPQADTKALFARELAARDHAAREAGRQAQKQREAAARRQWHKLGGAQRSAWERQAAHEGDRWWRHCQGADAAAKLAARLVAEVQAESQTAAMTVGA